MAYCVRLCAMAGKLGGSQPSFDLDELSNANASPKCQVECVCFVFLRGKTVFFSEGRPSWIESSTSRLCVTQVPQTALI